MEYAMPKNSIMPRGFKLNKVIDRLTLDFLRILQPYIGFADLPRDKLCAALWLLLKKSQYVNNLLFRNYNLTTTELMTTYVIDGKPVSLNRQSLIYVEWVFVLHRLQLINRLGNNPGNLHLLFSALSTHSLLSEVWKETNIERKKSTTQKLTNKTRLIANKLAYLCEKLGDDYSEVSKRRKLEYGDLYLSLADSLINMPEEMTLLDSLWALPLPLDTKSLNDKQVQLLFNRVIDALNVRYMLLRACGLDPEFWYEKPGLSINILKDIRQLRIEADKVLNEQGGNRQQVYEKVYITLKEKQKSFAGCTNFAEFSETELGQTILYLPLLSMEHEQFDNNEDGSSPLVEILADSAKTPEEQLEQQQEEASHIEWVETLISANPQLFEENLVMQYYFRHVIGLGVVVYEDVNQGGLLTDKNFTDLLEKSETYQNLPTKSLAMLLRSEAKTIITKGIKKCKKN